MTYSQSAKIAALMKQASTRCVDVYYEGAVAWTGNVLRAGGTLRDILPWGG